MLIKWTFPDTDMASEQLMIHSEESEAVVAEELKIQPDHGLASLHVKPCTLPAYTPPSSRKWAKSFHVIHTKFNNSFEREKERHRSVTNCSH